MPRRSIWKGSFVDALLLKMRRVINREGESCRKIWSRRPPIPPELVDRSVQIYNGKTPVRCKITEGKVGHKSGEFAFARKRHIKIYGAPRTEGRRGKGRR
uniref:Ribosomal protein S19 n=4 Tax=Taxaceae TaxID=25623 RepID=A0A6M3X3N5_TAXBA|nr:ribosomal protein S19 [Taxus chinensis]QJH92120.1 ribosomal protein S19 [Taxus baccata]WAI96654.1 ribosomal protein S19 [Taxus chinensis]